MKRSVYAGTVAVAATSLLLIGMQVPAPSVAASDATISIDAGLQFQRIDGFGISLVDQVPGTSGLPFNLASLTAAKRAEVMDLLFSETSGAGLDMLRIELGAGQTYPDNNGPVSNFTTLPTAPSSPTASPAYVWDGSADGQVQIAKDARARGVDAIYANAWSAPSFMKSNGGIFFGGSLCGFASCSSGDWRQAYANYLTKYVQLYAQSGVTIDYVSPFNEPADSPPWQSMTADPQQLAAFIATLGSTFDAAGLTTKIAATDVSNADDAGRYQAAISSNTTAAAHQDVASLHRYAGTAAAVGAAALAGKPTWQTEFTCVFDTWNTAYSSGDCNGEYWARTIHAALGNGIGAYFGWTGAWSHTDNEDLIRITGASSIEVSSRLYTMGNFAKFVVPGAQRLQASSSSSDVITTAFQNPNGNRVVVVTNTSAGPTALTLRGLAGGTVTPTVTNDADRLSTKAPTAVGSSGVTLTAPAKSTITYVFSGSTAAPSPQYELRNLNSGKILSIADSSTAEGATLWQWTDYDVSAQRWLLQPAGSGTYRIVSALSGRAVTLDGAVGTNGSVVTQRSWTGASTQRWRLLSVIDGVVLIANEASGKVLCIRDSTGSDGGLAHQWTWLDASSQAWRLVPTS